MVIVLILVVVQIRLGVTASSNCPKKLRSWNAAKAAKRPPGCPWKEPIPCRTQTRSSFFSVAYSNYLGFGGGAL